MEVEYVPSQAQVADILTKPLARIQFCTFQDKFRLLNTTEFVGGNDREHDYKRFSHYTSTPTVSISNRFECLAT